MERNAKTGRKDQRDGSRPAPKPEAAALLTLSGQANALGRRTLGQGRRIATSEDVIVERFAQRQLAQHEKGGLPVGGQVIASSCGSLVQGEGQSALLFGSALGS